MTRLFGLMILSCLVLAALPELQSGPALKSQSFEVIEDNVWVRTGPGKQYATVRSLSGGQRVHGYLTRDGQWLKIAPREFIAAEMVARQDLSQSKAHRIKPLTDYLNQPAPALVAPTTQPTETDSLHREVIIVVCLFVLMMALAWWSYSRQKQLGIKQGVVVFSKAQQAEPQDDMTAMLAQLGGNPLPRVKKKKVGPLLHTPPLEAATGFVDGGSPSPMGPDDGTFDHVKWEKVLVLRLVYAYQKQPLVVLDCLQGMMRKFADDPIFQADLVQLAKLLKPYQIVLPESLPIPAGETLGDWMSQDEGTPYFPREFLQALLSGLDSALCPYHYVADRDRRFLSETNDFQLSRLIAECDVKLAVAFFVMMPVTRVALILGMMGPSRTTDLLQAIALHLDSLTLGECNQALQLVRDDISAVDREVWEQTAIGFMTQLKDFLSPDQLVYLENKPIPGLPWLGRVWSASHKGVKRRSEETEQRSYPEGVPDLPYEILLDHGVVDPTEEPSVRSLDQ